AGAARWAQVVVAALDPADADRGREPVARHVVGDAEGIARALHDQRRRADPLEVGGAQALRLPGRVERVAEADEPARADLVREQPRHAPSERLAADREPRGTAEALDPLAPGREQHGRPVERAAHAGFAPLRHVGELEAHYADP